MTRDDIIRLAREAEIPGSWDLNWFDPYLDSFAALVAAHEREECAKVALRGTGEPVQTRTLEILLSERRRIADAINARGEER